MKEIRYSLYVFGAMFIFASMGIFAKLSGQNGLVIAAVASLVSAFSILIILKKEEIKGIFTKKSWMLVLIGLLGAANNGMYFYAFTMTKISNAVFLHYIAPAFVLVLLALVFKENISFRKALAIILGLSGLALIVGKPNFISNESIGNMLAIGSALFYAGSLIVY